MFRKRKKQDIIVPEPAETTPVEQIAFESLPFIDNETLDDFLADQDSVELLPVDPSDYRREIQRMIVSAFLHEASTQAKARRGGLAPLALPRFQVRMPASWRFDSRQAPAMHGFGILDVVAFLWFSSRGRVTARSWS